MRIATLSDLHTDYEDNRDVLVKLAVEIHDRGADCVVVAGDVSHKDDRIARALEGLKVAAPQVAYLPGNHDLWMDLEPGADTWRRYREHLADLCRGIGVAYLPAAPLVVGSVAIAGTCGWYDNGFLLPRIVASLPEGALEAKRLGAVGWTDARFVRFLDADGAPMTDAAVARTMEGELAAQLAALDADPGVEQVVVATHHLGFEQAVLRSGGLPWEFFNGFMGSPRLGEVILGGEKVTHAVYGHTHRGRRFEVAGRQVYGTPLGYPRERAGLSSDEVVRTRIGWIEIDT